MTTAICAFMKRENAYIDEWLKHHISIGIDKIILFDNNDNMEDYPNLYKNILPNIICISIYILSYLLLIT